MYGKRDYHFSRHNMGELQKAAQHSALRASLLCLVKNDGPPSCIGIVDRGDTPRHNELILHLSSVPFRRRVHAQPQCH
jgi:hypothetical protein